MLTSASNGAGLTYDPLLRLYQTSGGRAGTTRFAYDGSDLDAEYNGSNQMLRRYVHRPGTDERGSVVAVTDNAIAINRYDEYGIPQSTNMGRFQYTGQTWIPELGMYNYKARIYSPTLGRFMQTDPIGYDDGMNLYAYVGGDPVNKVDPTGLQGNSAGSRIRGGGSSRSSSGGAGSGGGGGMGDSFARSFDTCVRSCGSTEYYPGGWGRIQQ